MSDVAVVGAGLSGIACARALREAGARVRVLDRGRVPGGRMASRTLWDRRVDLGASYFTVTDDGFSEVVAGWAARGLAREWTDTFCVLGDEEPEAKTGPVRWGAAHGLRTLVEDLADGLDVEQAEPTALNGLGDVVVLAMPDPQARRLVGDHPVTGVLTREWEPVLALAARWPTRAWDGASPTGRFDGAFVNGDDVLAWVADDGRRRGDDAPVLVAHSTPGFAAQHLDDPSAAAPAMTQALRGLLDLPAPEDAHVHRWTFARPVGDRDEPYALVEGDLLVGACGDGWGPTAKVETAWVSGTRLGRALAERLT